MTLRSSDGARPTGDSQETAAAQASFRELRDALAERFSLEDEIGRGASGIVYREGVNFLEGVEPSAVAALSLRYLRKRDENRRLVEQLKGSTAPGAARAAELLARAGTRAALEDFD